MQPQQILASAQCDRPIAINDGHISSHYGLRDYPWDRSRLTFHYGIDIAADEGTPVRAIQDGYVYFARRSKTGGGLAVMMRSPGGLKFKFAHLSKLLVKRGARVQAGQVIGEVGSTGRSKGPHLHLEIYRNHGHDDADFLDPEPFVCAHAQRIVDSVNKPRPRRAVTSKRGHHKTKGHGERTRSARP